jgi:hypothetical protein
MEEHDVNTAELYKKLAETAEKLSVVADTVAEILSTWEAEKADKAEKEEK